MSKTNYSVFLATLALAGCNNVPAPVPAPTPLTWHVTVDAQGREVWQLR